MSDDNDDGLIVWKCECRDCGVSSMGTHIKLTATDPVTIRTARCCLCQKPMATFPAVMVNCVPVPLTEVRL